jgi:phosphatidylserine/phosphatidylglycerophosphate/cardiolipin synthase-like enzyme
MFTPGPKVDGIETFLLSQVEAKVESKPIEQQQALAAITTQAKEAAERFAAFVAVAKQTLDICIYDFRLEVVEVRDVVVQAINGAAERGVTVRIAYDKNEKGDEPILKLFRGAGGDPAPTGTDKFLRVQAGLNNAVQIKPIAEEAIDAGHQIMHNKYLVRDAGSADAAVWMGSANFTIDAWALQENNIVVFTNCPDLAAKYEQDFADLWQAQALKGTGKGLEGAVDVTGQQVSFGFAPGEGKEVEKLIAETIQGAQKRVRIASMVLSSVEILEALKKKIDAGLDVAGIYDKDQTLGVRKDWERFEKDASKVQLLNEVIAHLVAKGSEEFDQQHPEFAHNFMHNKVAVADDTIATGSFNFSLNATRNAENVIAMSNGTIADGYAQYIDGLIARYR